jgi:hypothetical protein
VISVSDRQQRITDALVGLGLGLENVDVLFDGDEVHITATRSPAERQRHWWCTSSGRIELELTAEDAKNGSHQGQCADDVRELSRLPYIAEQLAKIDPKLLADELNEWGAWNETELADHDQNIQRVLWLACSGIAEELT